MPADIYLEIYENDDDYYQQPLKRFKLEGVQLGTSSRQTNTGGGREREPEVPNLQDIHVLRKSDGETQYFQRLALEGRPLRMAIRFYDLKNETVYMTLRLEQVLISGFSISGGSGGPPMESITLNFTKAKYNYDVGPLKDEGKGTPTK